MGYAKCCFKSEVHSDTDLPQEKRKDSNKQPNVPPKRIRKRRTKKAQNQQRKEIKKIREEINKIEMKRNREDQ